jgi:type IV pilus assembly protein PilC
MVESEFLWRGYDREARLLSGKTKAINKQAVVVQLHAQRIRPTHISRQRHLPQILRFKSRIRSTDITRLSRQLATLLESGVPLIQAFDIIARGVRRPALKALVKDIRHQVEGGMALHLALRHHREFDAFFCQLVAVGELAGMLGGMLLRLSIHREKSEDLRRTLRSALVYPTAVLVIALSVMIFLLTFVVPAFENIFSSFNAELPALTRGVIALSRTWQHMDWSFLAVIVGLLYVIQKGWQRQLRLRWLGHAMLLQLPVVGRLIRYACLARWSRTLATLFAAGVPLTDALEATQKVTGHSHYEAATIAIQGELIRGQSLAQALAQHRHLFSQMLIQMCTIGEESGMLERMLERSAAHYENEVGASVARLTTLVEPLIMLSLGLLIGGMVIALYLPIFQLGQVL